MRFPFHGDSCISKSWQLEKCQLKAVYGVYGCMVLRDSMRFPFRGDLKIFKNWQLEKKSIFGDGCIVCMDVWFSETPWDSILLRLIDFPKVGNMSKNFNLRLCMVCMDVWFSETL